MVGMWILVKTVWKTLARILRHFGWGGLLPVVAAMGMALFGVLPWTVALVLCALIVAAWWPAVAADLLPVTMLLAGIWALLVAAVAGSTANWLVAGRAVAFRGPQALQILAKKRALAGKVPPGAVQKPVSGSGFTVYGAKGQVLQETLAPQAHSVHAVAGPGGGITVFPWNAKLHGPPPGPFGPPKPVGGPVPVAHGGGLLPTGLLVPLALLLLALGLWLTPRAMARLRDRMPWLVPYLRRWAVENRWGVLLIPVTLFGLVVFGVHPWTVAAVLIAVIAVVRWPKVAADLVPVALLCFAAWGFAIASSWQSLAPGHEVRYGAVQVSSPHMALLAGVEASVFLAFAAWLIPRTIGAHARTLLRPEPDPELTGRVRRLTETRGHAIDAATSELRRIERDLHDGAQARLVATWSAASTRRCWPTAASAMRCRPWPWTRRCRSGWTWTCPAGCPRRWSRPATSRSPRSWPTRSGTPARGRSTSASGTRTASCGSRCAMTASAARTRRKAPGCRAWSADWVPSMASWP
jgi:uncharacterized membrane protein YvlD (DUF360 family)